MSKLDDLSPSYLPKLLSSLLTLSKAASLLPNSTDHKYYNTTSHEYNNRVAALVKKTLNGIDRINSKITPNEKYNYLAEYNKEEDKYEYVVDHIDICLGRVDTCIENIKGRKIPTQEDGNNIAIASTGIVKNKTPSRPNMVNSNIPKPQAHFNPQIDNSVAPFVPLLKFYKPFAKTPLADYGSALKAIEEARATNNYTNVCKMSFLHPYLEEISSLSYQSSNYVSMVKEQLFKPLTETKLNWVSTEAELIELYQKLNNVTEFAVDLEHHDYRSYQGLTCLMQISTRTEDYLIDVIELRSVISMHLLPAFANPSIVKVLHGSDRDIIWLQRDLGLYVVNMFDTGQASRVLEMSRFSLQHLLKLFCDVNVDKKYQLADWRVRPLPSEMLKYAREDTHYLLYIYDRMRNMLFEKNRLPGNVASNGSSLLTTWKQSSVLTLSVYTKEIVDDNTISSFCSNNGLVFHNAQYRVFRSLFFWRDNLARELDESVRYILPNRLLIGIATSLPHNLVMLNQCCVPMPPPIRSKLNEILELIQVSKNDNTFSPPPVVSHVEKSITGDGALESAGWNISNYHPSTNYAPSNVSNAIAYSSTIPIDPNHVVLNSSDLSLGEAQRRVFDNFDAVGFALDSAIVAKNAQLSSSVPSSVVFSEIISSENSTNYDAVKLVEQTIASTSLYQLLGPIDADYSTPSFMSEVSKADKKKANSDELAKFRSFEFTELPGKKPRGNEITVNNMVVDTEPEPSNEEKNIDIAKFTSSIGWSNPLPNPSTSANFVPFDYNSAAKNASFNQPTEASKPYNPYTNDVKQTHGKINRGPQYDIMKSNKKIMTYKK